MRIVRFAVILIIAVLILSGCGQNVSLLSQAKKQFKSGNYEAALASNAQSLKLKPDYQKAQELLPQVFQAAVKQRTRNVEKIEASGLDSRWDSLVVEYQALIDIYDTMADLPPMTHPKTKIPFEYEAADYRPQLEESKQNAAEYHYQQGIEWSLKADDPDVQKNAAKEFKAAMSYVPNYKDSAELYDQTRKKGIKRIAIIPFEDRTGVSKFGSLSDMLLDQVTRSLLSDPSATEFLEIINRTNVENVLREQQLAISGLVNEASTVQLGKLLGAHEILTGKILQVEVVPERTIHSVGEAEKTITVYQGKTAVEKDVYCQYTKYTKTASANVTASLTITDVTNGTIRVQDSFTGKYEFNDSWVRINGDERALSKDIHTLATKDEPMPPSDTQMVNEALGALSGQFASKLKSYVK
ncbi:MAG TPA: CsgG/HfaB family protein [Candidatus Cloacimonadota bacterium]|nr:CsgG/HfaB family protein [Candidatus Cloacimonadota bacterium]